MLVGQSVIVVEVQRADVRTEKADYVRGGRIHVISCRLVRVTCIDACREPVGVVPDGADAVERLYELVYVAEEITASESGRVAEGLARDLHPILLRERDEAAEHISVEVSHFFRRAVRTHEYCRHAVHDDIRRAECGRRHAVDSSVRDERLVVLGLVYETLYLSVRLTYLKSYRVRVFSEIRVVGADFVVALRVYRVGVAVVPFPTAGVEVDRVGPHFFRETQRLAVSVLFL